MKVLYISYDGMTDQLGRSQVLPYLCGLSRRGIAFHLISFEKNENFHENRAAIEDIVKKNNITWVPLRYTKKPPVLSTILDIRLMLNTALHLHKKNNFDLMHCRSYISSIVGLKLYKRFNLPFLFDMRGFWADERVEGGIWNLSNPIYNVIYKYFKNLEKKFLNKSVKVVVLTERGKREILSWNQRNCDSNKITVIPCCADLDLFDFGKINTTDKNALRQKLGIDPDDIVLTYLGAIGTWYMLREMLDFFRIMTDSYPDAKFLFITGDSEVHIKESAAASGIDPSKIIVTRSRREDVPVHISSGDIGIFFIKPVYSKQASSPTKQGEIMGMGIPIICNHKIGDTDMILEDSGAGFIVAEFSTSAYKEAVQAIPSLLQIKKESIRHGAEKYYSLISGVDKYYKIYQKIMDDGKVHF